MHTSGSAASLAFPLAPTGRQADHRPEPAPDREGTRRGVLLVNLGTPASPEPGSVRRYLREFLSDGRVMDIHPVLRRLVLETMILPFRPREAAHAYRAVWSEGGSPLLVHGRDLARELSRAWGDGTQVALAMRYGQPAIRDVLPALVRQVDQVDVLLLYPHAAASTTGSAVAEIYRVLGQLWDAPPVRILDPWYDHPAYLRSLGKVYGEALDAFEPDHILFSYHGIPTRHLERSAPFHSCATSTERCHRTGAARGGCYRAQCLETSHGVAREMGLADGSWSSAFQSRFGKDPWVGPETEATLRELARNGTRRVAVACPGFAADCLETLEEMGIRGRDAFLEEGGEEFLLLPCANSHPAWVEGLVSILRPRADALA